MTKTTKKLFLILGGIGLLALGIMLSLNILSYKVDYDEVITTEGNKFSQLYPNVGQDNDFKFASSEEILELFSSGTGLIFLGFPECPWCQKLAPIVYDAAKTENFKDIYYYNVKEGRSSNSATYQELVKRLEPYLEKDEAGEPRIYVPDLTAIKNGKIVARFEMEDAPDEESKSPDMFWTESRKSRAVRQVRDMIRAL